MICTASVFSLVCYCCCIIRPHRSTTYYVDAAYCYRRSIAWSVGLSVCHASEPCKKRL